MLGFISEILHAGHGFAKLIFVSAVTIIVAATNLVITLAGTTVEMQGYMNVINLLAVGILFPYTLWSLKSIVSETKDSIGKMFENFDTFKEKVNEKFQDAHDKIGEVELKCQRDINKVMSDQVERISKLIEIVKK